MLNLSSGIKYAVRIAIGVAVSSGLVLALSCSNHELELKSNAQVVKTPTIQASNTPEVNTGSDASAVKLTELYNNKNCKEFFNAFPNTFEEFDRLYGFEDEKGGRILYSQSEEHISFFFGCSEVSDLEKLKKSLGIGINGRWEADGSALVQSSAFNLIKDHPNETKKILDALTDIKASSFWYFLFDGPHPGDKENVKKVELLQNVLGKNSKQSKLLSEQHRKLVVDWSDH